VFLVAETFSCNLSEKDYRDCNSLTLANFIVTSQLVASAGLYLLTEISVLRLSREDMVALRNVDAGYIFRYLAHACTWVIALGVFGGRPRDVESGFAKEKRIGAWDGDVTLVIDIVAMFVLFLLWGAIFIWERYHVQHKINNDQVLSGEREHDEIGNTLGGRVGRSWLRRTERINKWIAERAVGDTEARTSPMFQWIACAITWSITACSILSVILLAVKHAPGTILLYKAWTILKFSAAVCSAAAAFFDLRDRPDNGRFDYVRLGMYSILVGEIVHCAVSYHIWPGEHSAFINTCLVAGICLVCVRLHKRAVTSSTLEERRKHVYEVVFPKTLQLAFPFIVISSEMLACNTEAFVEVMSNATSAKNSTDTGGIFADATEPFEECDGIILGCTPLVLIMLFLFFSQALYVSAETTFTLKNIARLKLSSVDLTQIAVFGVCGVYALYMYSLREKRAVSWEGFDGMLYYAFVLLLTAAAMAGSLKSEGVGFERQSRGSSASRRSSASGGRESRDSGGDIRATRVGRKSMDMRKSIWEGGMKGAVGKGGIASASKRGLVAEKVSGGSFGDAAGGQRGRGISDAALNPGFI